MDIDTAWKNTCRVLFRGEVGELQDFEGYLSQYAEPLYQKESVLSGRRVILSSPSFCRDAKFIDGSEAGEYDEMLRNAELDMDEIKDIDSILDALEGKLCYSGNIVIGNSREVHDSNNCSNVSVVYNSMEIYDSRYIAFSGFRRFDEYVFGSVLGGESKFLISCFGNYRNSRCVGTLRTFTSSDCFYTANLENCADCLFSFNQKNKRNLVGNLELPSDKYLEVKDKLIAEMREMLKSRKEIPTIIDIIRGGNG